MEKPVTFAVCGLGVRGMEAYASFQARHPEKMKITAEIGRASCRERV